MIELSSGLHIPEVEYANQGNAILGIRDSGKSYTATWLAERLLDAGIPFVAFDPIGVWRNLKLPGTGKGYEVVVAGDDGDIALTPEAAPQIVRAAMRENIPLIIDLYSMSLSKADWKRIVETCVRILLFENKRHGLRHVFIEEAAEFAPQRVGPDTGRVYAEIEKLARMGGNAGLGYTLINQRAEEVNKAILELCDCLFLHRQKGRHSLTALGKWLDAGDVKNRPEIIRSLPSLGQGECWVWPQGSNTPARVKIPVKRSHHPDRRNLSATAAAAKASVNVGRFVERLGAAITAESKPGAALAPVQERQLADMPSAQRVGELLERIDKLETEYVVALDEHRRLRASMELIADRLSEYSTEIREALVKSALPPSAAAPHVRGQGIPPALRKAMRRTPTAPTAAEKTPVSKAVRAILAVLKAHHPKPRSRESVALQAGYSAGGGGFQNALSQARTSGLIQGSGELSITAVGLAVTGDVAPIPTGRALVDYWARQLDRAPREILIVATAGKRRFYTREHIARETGYQASGGGFQNALSRLRTLGLISSGREIEAAPEFFA